MTPPSRRAPLFTTVAGLLTAAVGDGSQGYDGPGPFIFLALAAVVAWRPRRWLLVTAVVMSVVFLIGALVNPEVPALLANPSQLWQFLAALAQLTGFVVAAIAGSATVWPRRPTAVSPPRGRAVRGTRASRRVGEG